MLSSRMPRKRFRPGQWSIFGLALPGWILALTWTLDQEVRGAETVDSRKSIARLEVLPAKVRLFGSSASQRLVVVGVGADGSRRDVTVDARLESKTPDRVKVESDGEIRPVADGAGKSSSVSGRSKRLSRSRSNALLDR